MRLPGTMRINQEGHLEIGGCDTVKLVAEYGTPLYVFDEEAVRQACRTYKEEMSKAYPNSRVAYAGKAFLTKAMASLAAQEGLYLDVVSGGELYTALAAEFPAERILFHGNNKTASELTFAVNEGVGRIVVDSLYELHLLNDIAAQNAYVAEIYLRLQPGVEAHTHSYIQTGQLDSKFGFGISSGQALEAVLSASALSNIRLVGLHCHIGSQIFDLDAFAVAARIMTRFMARLWQEYGIRIEELDLGGGLGIESDVTAPVADLAATLAQAVEEESSVCNLEKPVLTVEPGRSIVGPYGTTLYTVGPVKSIPDVRDYLAVDGGMTDNPRPALYQARYRALLANRVEEKLRKNITVAGRCCETGDILIKDCLLADPRPGDILAVLETGAYNYSMSSNYNRLPRPAVVGVCRGESYVMVERETYEDLCQRDRIPVHFRHSLKCGQIDPKECIMVNDEG